MTGKDAARWSSAWKSWRKPLSAVLAAGLVVAVCLAARYVWGPASARAQSPPAGAASKTKAKGANTPTRVAAQPSAANASSAPASTAPGPQPTGIVAVVNGQQVTRDELGRECLKRYGEEVLESMINKHLIWQACQQRQIIITPQDVEKEIENMAKKFGLSTDNWLTMLERERRHHAGPISSRDHLAYASRCSGWRRPRSR